MKRNGKENSSSESSVITTSCGYTGMVVYSTRLLRMLAATFGL